MNQDSSDLPSSDASEDASDLPGPSIPLACLSLSRRHSTNRYLSNRYLANRYLSYLNDPFGSSDMPRRYSSYFAELRPRRKQHVSESRYRWITYPINKDYASLLYERRICLYSNLGLLPRCCNGLLLKLEWRKNRLENCRNTPQLAAKWAKRTMG